MLFSTKQKFKKQFTLNLIKCPSEYQDSGYWNSGNWNSGYWGFGILEFGKLEFGKLGFGKLYVSGNGPVRDNGIREIDFGKRYIRENGIREIVRQGIYYYSLLNPKFFQK